MEHENANPVSSRPSRFACSLKARKCILPSIIIGAARDRIEFPKLQVFERVRTLTMHITHLWYVRFTSRGVRIIGRDPDERKQCANNSNSLYAIS